MVNLRKLPFRSGAFHKAQEQARLLTACKRSCIVPAMNMLEVIVKGADAAARHGHQLSCPFCGNDPPLAAQIHGRFIVGCESDDCHVNPQVSGASVSEAWARWNRRPA